MISDVGNVFFRYRNSLLPVACVLLLLPGADPFPDPMGAAFVGGAVAVLGQLIRAATIGLRYVVRGGRNRRVYAEDLVTDGIYAHLRNPMYVGNLMIASGLAIASNSWTVIVVALPLGFFIYASIVAAEEQYLAARFGARFEAYCRAVPRWLPRLTGLGRTLSSMQFHWRRLLLKEYGTPFGWMSVLVLMTLYNIWMSDQWMARTGDVHTLKTVFVTTFLLWLLAWSIKRTRYLVAD